MKKFPISGIGLFIAYALAVVSSNIIFPYLFKDIIDLMTTAEPSPLIATALYRLVLLMTVLVLFYNLMYRIGDYMMSYFQSNALRELADFSFKELHKHSYTFFANHFAGALVTKTKRFIRSFETLHDKFVYMFFFSGIKVVGITIVLFLFSPLISLLFLVWLLIYCAVVFFFIRKKIPLDLAESAADSDVTARYADTLTNVLTIKMFASQKTENAHFENTTHSEEQKRRRTWYFGNFQRVVEGLLFAVVELAIIMIMVKMWLDGNMTIGTIVLIQLYILATFDVIWNIGRTLTETARALADAKEMVDIFEQKPDVLDPPHPEACRITSGKIAFEKVCFSYDGADGVFDNFSLMVNAGQRVGLVGHSGAGKTTITKLLLRFTNIDHGVITIDGQDISQISQDALRRKIAYVPQEPLLFHRTLRENIAYGDPDATDEAIITAAKKANAHDFIASLTNGYDTLVGERGVKLSGGERQRVAIARAMLKDAPILILDEATSSLDSMSEKMIQEAFEELMKGRTTIVIAHRLSTIQKMDRIIVLDNGKIAEEGTHDELIANNGAYATFWQQQTGGYLRE